MDPAIKKVAIVIALALIVVLGLIFVTRSADSKEAQIATAQNSKVEQKTQETEKTEEANAQELPADEAKASEVSTWPRIFCHQIRPRLRFLTTLM